MDGSAAIETNRQALLRILAGLLVLAGWADSAFDAHSATGKTLPRRLRTAILRILRPAEAATRRLAIALAGSLPPLPPIRLRKSLPQPKQQYIEISPKNAVFPGQRKTGILLPRDTLKRFGPDGTIQAYLIPRPMLFVPVTPPEKHNPKKRARSFVFRLLDPLPNPTLVRRQYAPRHNVPRASTPGLTVRQPLPRPRGRGDQLDGTSLARRLAILAEALNDLPKQARRYRRWQALRIARKAKDQEAGAARPSGRLSPLRPGRPPGCRLASYDPYATRRKRIREIDDILAHAHNMALYALERRDTS